MEICITAMEGNLNATVDARFGRAAWILIVDTNTGQLLEAIENSSGKAAAHGAGIVAAALVADKGVQAVLTGRVGPKAVPVLEKANVQIVNNVSGTVQSALKSFSEETRTIDTTQPAQTGLGQGRCGQGKGLGQGRGQGRGQCQR